MSQPTDIWKPDTLFSTIAVNIISDIIVRLLCYLLKWLFSRSATIHAAGGSSAGEGTQISQSRSAEGSSAGEGTQISQSRCCRGSELNSRGSEKFDLQGGLEGPVNAIAPVAVIRVVEEDEDKSE